MNILQELRTDKRFEVKEDTYQGTYTIKISLNGDIEDYAFIRSGNVEFKEIIQLNILKDCVFASLISYKKLIENV